MLLLLSLSEQQEQQEQQTVDVDVAKRLLVVHPFSAACKRKSKQHLRNK